MTTAAVMVVGITGVAEAAAPTVSCGAILKTDAVLTKDLKCTNGNGVTLYRGVTLDLAGHALIGPGESGTAVTLSYKGGSSVINGRIQNWAIGLAQDSSSQSSPVPAATVKNIQFTHATSSVQFGASLSVIDSTFVGSGLNMIAGNTLSVTSSTFSFSNIVAPQSTLRISGSSISGGSVTGSDGYGASIDNTAMDGTGTNDQISYCYQSEVSITNSTIRNYKQPIAGIGCTVTLENNAFKNNTGGVLKKVSYNSFGGSATVSKNTFQGNGIAVQGDRAMSITGNTFTANATGVYVTDPTDDWDTDVTDSVITGNTFVRNTSSGIRSAAVGVSIGNNVAVDNGRYGIYSPQASDRGGNIAHGNKLANCVGVICATR